MHLECCGIWKEMPSKLENLVMVGLTADLQQFDLALQKVENKG